MTIESPPSLNLLTPRALLQGSGNADALENVIPTQLPNGAACYVLDQNAYYNFDKFSTAAVSAPDVIATALGASVPGRWVKRADAGGGGAATYIKRTFRATLGDSVADLNLLGNLLEAADPIGDYEIIAYQTVIVPGTGPGGNIIMLGWNDGAPQLEDIPGLPSSPVGFVGNAKAQIVGSSGTRTITKATLTDPVEVYSQDSTPGIPGTDAEAYLEVLYRLL